LFDSGAPKLDRSNGIYFNYNRRKSVVAAGCPGIYHKEFKMNVVRRRVFLLLLLLALGWSRPAVFSWGADPAAQPKLPPREQFHLFLLVGQSNMAGRGKVADQDKEPIPRVLALSKEGRWVPALDPLHFDKPNIVGVGIGRSFAAHLTQADPNITVGLIPCAVGGSPIASWEPGGYHASTKTHPWDDALPRAKLALQSGTLKGILWHQGESDSRPQRAQVYEEKLHALVARFRRELKAEAVPFLAGQMGQFKEKPWSDDKKLVDAAQRNLPKHIPHTAFVSSDGLSHKGDQVHFDAKSYRELGRRYAVEYLRIVSAASQP